MARRPGSVKGGRARSSTPEYVGGSSDKRYQSQTRDRLRAEAWRRWGLRLAILAVLGFAVRMWGASVRDYVVSHGRGTVKGLQNTGKGLKSGVDERSGKDFNPNE